jgi:hypothetical protein
LIDPSGLGSTDGLLIAGIVLGIAAGIGLIGGFIYGFVTAGGGTAGVVGGVGGGLGGGLGSGGGTNLARDIARVVEPRNPNVRFRGRNRLPEEYELRDIIRDPSATQNLLGNAAPTIRTVTMGQRLLRGLGFGLLGMVTLGVAPAVAVIVLKSNRAASAGTPDTRSDINMELQQMRGGTATTAEQPSALRQRKRNPNLIL